MREAVRLTTAIQDETAAGTIRKTEASPVTIADFGVQALVSARLAREFPDDPLVPGTRSTFAERQTGREYVDIVPNREAIARYGLTVRDVQDVVEAAVGGMTVSTAIAGRAARAWGTSPTCPKEFA